MSQYVENIIQEKMDKINSKGNVYEVGRVIGVTDYIVEVSGLIQVSFNEKVVIAGHSIGYVSLIRRNSILVSVLQSDNSIFIGDEVIATGEPFHANSLRPVCPISWTFSVQTACVMKSLMTASTSK